MNVGVVGCGLMGHKRTAALGDDELVAAYDIDAERARELAGDRAVGSQDEVFERADAVIVAVQHNALPDVAVAALEAGCRVLVEKPAGISVADVDRIAAAADKSGQVARVGFNHRFHPAIAQAIETARSGRFGDVMFVRGRYGHGGRIGYDKEWRADPATGGGGELTDQGMHLLDLTHWLFSPAVLPLHSALLRTNYWDMRVEDNAALLLGEPGAHDAPWAQLHVTWTEWKNLFSLEIYCRTGKLQVDGLQGSYGPQKLTVYAMKPELGPPDVETFEFDREDVSWAREWEEFREATESELDSARWCWEVVEEAYRREGYPLSRRTGASRQQV